MAVRLDPDQTIAFERPLTRIVKSSIHIYNDSNEPVVFKVKTTAPKTYCVRPNVGRIAPLSYLTVQVLLQPFKEEPPSDFTCKDKFLILSMPAGDSNATTSDDIHRLWTAAESSGKKNNISQTKLRCAYVHPVEEKKVASESSAPAVPPPAYESIPTVEKVIEDRKFPISNGYADKSPVPATSTSADAREETQNAVQDLKARLEQYERELSELRQRKIQQSEPVAAVPKAAVQTVSSNGGYPPHVLILVALLSFAVAYLLLSKQ